MLISLVYVSIAEHPMTDAELVALLEECRENNQKLDITGMLLYRDDFFIQALEGDAASVEPLYEAIAQDERHQNLVLVYKEPITERQFTDWSMGFNKLSDADLDGIEGYEGRLNAELFESAPDRAHKLLTSFANRSYF